MSLLREILVRSSGNRTVLWLLDRVASECQWFMGIGSGDQVDSSGEGSALRLLLANNSGPYCVFDVGSNRGQYLGLASRMLSNRPCEIHCFEPNSFSFEQLKSMVAEGSLHRVSLNNVALGQERGTAQLYSHGTDSGLSSLTRRRLDHYGIELTGAETVEVRTVDDYCREHDIQTVHLLKCDVEGHELDVFEGGSEMFSKGAVGLVSFEFGGCNIDTRSFFQDFWYFFRDVNMRMYRITPSGFLSPVRVYSESLEQFRTTDYLAVSNGSKWTFSLPAS